MFQVSKPKNGKAVKEDVEAQAPSKAANAKESSLPISSEEEGGKSDEEVNNSQHHYDSDDSPTSSDEGEKHPHYYATYHPPSTSSGTRSAFHHPHHKNHLQRLFKRSESDITNDEVGRLSTSQTHLNRTPTVRFDLSSKSKAGSKASLFKSSCRNLAKAFQIEIKDRLKEKVERNYHDTRLCDEELESVRRPSDRNELLAQIRARNEMDDNNNQPADNNHLQVVLPQTPRTPTRTPSPAARNRNQSTYFPGRIRKRVILKNGTYNLSSEHLNKKSRRYFQDVFTTMVDIKWRWNLMVFALGFLLSWFFYGIVWWLIAFSHNDFEHADDENWTPCVSNIKNFISALLFSIETQHTIGYGSRYTTEECPEALFVMCLQSVTGVMISCFMVGFVFAKLSRPQKRSQTLMFSRNAIVCVRDNKLCVMFRVGDLRNRSHIIGAKVSAQVIQRKISPEGEVIPYYHRNLVVKFDEVGDDVFLIWPATIVHTIDEASPFWEMNADDMMNLRFEIVAILEGTIESTGQSIQARTSYLPSEILWGNRFEQLIKFRKETCEYVVDYAKFNSIYEIDTPMCSAKEFQEELEKEAKIRWDFLESRMDLRTQGSGDSQSQSKV